MKRQPRQLREILKSSDLIDPAELALALRVSRPTVYSWVSKGTIPYLRFMGLVRFEPGAIKDWLASRRQGPGTTVRCPFGGAVGRDFLDFEECSSCPVKNECCELAAHREVG